MLRFKDMEREYRVATVKDGSFPQVRFRNSFLWVPYWTLWRKIARHPSGFGYYSVENRNYPKTESEARQIIKDFDEWYNGSNVKATYKKIEL